MTVSKLRRSGGILLVLVWAQIATANAVPCVIECLLDTRHSEEHHHMAGHTPTAGHHSGIPTISNAGRCDTPQLVLVAAIPAEFPASPVVDTRLTLHVSARIAADPSVPPRLDTPPPRASIIV